MEMNDQDDSHGVQTEEKIPVDLDTATEVRDEEITKQQAGKLLPKLSKRLVENSHNERTSSINFFTPRSGGPSSPSKSIRLRDIDYSLQSEALRNQDLELEPNSAASIALAKAIAIGVANHTNSSAAPTLSNIASSSSDHEYHLHAAEEKSDGSNTPRIIEGRQILQDHDQYALTYGMMLGIRVTTGRRDVLNRDKSLHDVIPTPSQPVDTPLEREITDDDYAQSMQLVFLPNGSNGPPFPTPPHKLPFPFKFKDYMTNVFRAVRTLCGIDEADYMLSLAGQFNYIEFLANSKSGQFFFYSYDGKYMIKTQTSEESKLLRKVMKRYVEYLATHPNSLLVKFYGMHRVKMKTLRSKVHFVIMSSVFDTDRYIDVKYDLKGSTIGRVTSQESCDKGAVQKDINFMQSGRKLRFGRENVKIFYNTLQEDVEFLKSINIMDYSLLVGIHNKNPTSEERVRRPSINRQIAEDELRHNEPIALSSIEVATPDRNIFRTDYGGIASEESAHEIYFLGIIDILQLYNATKQFENFFKGFTKDRSQLSAVPPSTYASRMLEFIMSHTDYYDHYPKKPNASNATTTGKTNKKSPSGQPSDKKEPANPRKNIL